MQCAIAFGRWPAIWLQVNRICMRQMDDSINLHWDQRSIHSLMAARTEEKSSCFGKSRIGVNIVESDSPSLMGQLIHDVVRFWEHSKSRRFDPAGIVSRTISLDR